ncbi:hypothetical protein CERSUDRAFT_108991 [Gelatoporia subvermispora B]|uniref:Uncharacterized protein n=1 Tax=Ceriporiopsis subvermispora (strain B) TaxID=914234 RepID=M2Q5I0_CERS8|nr:hypothetical protein CERSUDRAFT_108991 [Gelatoporia subvermispora B]
MEATLYALWAAFSAMRVYAIGNNSWMLAVLAGLFGMVPFATSVNILCFISSCWIIQYQSFPTQVSGIEALPGVGSWCLEFSDMSQTEQMKYVNSVLTIAARVCGITSDAIVLVETWRKTYSIKRDAMRHNIRTPLATMLMRDGTLYFVFILSLNVLDTIGKAFNIFDYTPTFMIPSFSIIISRFLLNLRQLGSEPYGNGASDTSGRDSGQSQSAGLRFASFIDNMGEDLDDESGSSDLAIAWDSPQSNAVDEEPQDSAVLTQGSSYPSAEQEMADIECNVHSRIPSYNEGTTNMCIVRREQ